MKADPALVISTDAEGAVATEAEWRDPDKVSSAMLLQGVLFKLPPMPANPGPPDRTRFWRGGVELRRKGGPPGGKFFEWTVTL